MGKNTKSPFPTSKNSFGLKTEPQLEQQIIEHLKLREGVRYKVYKDSLGKLTVGVGHLVLPEDKLKLGDTITERQVTAFLAKDYASSLAAAKEQIALIEVSLSPKQIQTLTEALTYVNFQLGTNWHKIHKNSWKLISKGNFLAASEEIKDSLWYAQTPVRVNDFSNFLIQAHNEK